MTNAILWFYMIFVNGLTELGMNYNLINFVERNVCGIIELIGLVTYTLMGCCDRFGMAREIILKDYCILKLWSVVVLIYILTDG